MSVPFLSGSILGLVGVGCGQPRLVVLGDGLARVVGEFLGLGHQFQSLEHVRISLGLYAHSLPLTEGADEQFALDAGADPIVVVHQVLFRVGQLGIRQEAAELLHNAVIHLEALLDLVADRIVLGRN